MSLSFDQLVKNPPALKPVPVDIEGLDEQVEIHRFTWDQLSELLDPEDGEAEVTGEQRIRDQVVRLLKGPGAEVTEEDVANVRRIFTVTQVRDIYQKGLNLNGFGVEAMREAQKK